MIQAAGAIVMFVVAAGRSLVADCGLRSSSGQRPQQPAGQAARGQQTIENKGSDTLVNLALAWAEKYMGEHPEVRISVTGGGSGTGSPP